MDALIDIPVLYQDQDIAFTFEAPALKDGQMLVHGFTAQEKLFALTQVDIELVSDDPRIDLYALLDTPATLTIHHKYAGIRHFSGVIAEIARADEGFRRTFYTVTLLPMLHRLDHGSDCRIFQQKSVPDIIRELLKENGVEDVQWHMAGEHVAREYCVQYRETHLAFVERIAAEEGIWYYFTHGENGQHTAHFIDMPQIVGKLPNLPELEYNANPGGAVKGVFCNRFAFHERLRSTSYTQRERLFVNPRYAQEHKAERQQDNGSKRDYALYNYPGRYKYDAAGKPFTKYRMEATRVDATTADGETNAVHLMPGYRVELTDHPNDACNDGWHLLTVYHKGEQPQALKEEAGSGATTYSNRFTAMPWMLNYRPPLTKRPMVDGPQIAQVSGPEGEEIYCDEWGRIKVTFPWDRYSENNEKSSCWIRVASNWAGATWGHIAIPRVGQEVIVDFLEGDPDQPIVTGRTYNAMNKTGYKLPDNKTRMSIRSQTHKGNGFNELRFEDEKGREEVFLRAERDMNTGIKNNYAVNVGGNSHRQVAMNSTAICNGFNADYSFLGRMLASQGTMSISTGEVNPIAMLSPAFFNLAGTVQYPFQNLIQSPEVHMSARPGSIVMNSAADYNVYTKGQMSIGTGEGMGVSAVESISFTSQQSASLSALALIHLYSKNNIIVASEGGMVLQAGNSQISLNSNGEIEITGTKIKINGEKICLN